MDKRESLSLILKLSRNAYCHRQRQNENSLSVVKQNNRKSEIVEKVLRLPRYVSTQATGSVAVRREDISTPIAARRKNGGLMAIGSRNRRAFYDSDRRIFLLMTKERCDYRQAVYIVI